MDYSKMSLTEVTRLPGVSDLEPLMARAKLAKALQAESAGNHEEAEKLLNDAILTLK